MLAPLNINNSSRNLCLNIYDKNQNHNASMNSTFKAREEVKEEGSNKATIVVKSIFKEGALTRLSSIDSLADKSTDNNTTLLAALNHQPNNRVAAETNQFHTH